ncbi:glycoside hydrolase family 73 protein [Myroides sp. LoEW2-1]|uniref:glycoside hydrolase family 73 protein n=1 Tax=Myroides sp. LoEW2-1 TaxID=2683192 RepID=UPI00132C6C27|nr:glucosaminidase domain-containing protein [Myroides sp. LoEW2-1]MVX36222.1 peptidoglycan hydrolase [Myroides sp. LoEW2-1]
MAYISFDELHKYEDNAAKYVDLHYADAKTVEDVYGMDFRILLTVSAVETGWGKFVKHNNYFGIKYAKNMEKQLITTTEYLDTPNAKFPEIISMTKVGDKYKYVVKDHFSVYPTPYDSFKGYYQFLSDNPRYKTALQYKNEPIRFFEEVAKAGYATAPNYAYTLKQVFNSVNKRL